jgi:hypothetical protein
MYILKKLFNKNLIYLFYYPEQEFYQNSAEYKKYINTNLQILRTKIK